ncbi:substrate-binding domain-containing protein [Halobacterium yunchengense]|uniref:substrate-binding domain-containing protein n=1 Tax=Halobacterium yunchengense TaxID=3108497 RepID=UPI003009F13B
MDRRRYLQALGAGGALSVAGCLGVGDGGNGGERGRAGGTLTLAAATTTHDSGLLDALVPEFEDALGADVRAVARGSSGALRTARDGDADVVLVHARSLEDAFLRDGHGVNRRALMVNDFLVVGPPDDPADAAGRDPPDAFAAVADAGAQFLSRGDGSGTHVREREIWDAAGVDPGGGWYSETGQGMGDTLVAARRVDAYTLVDRGTFLNVASGDLVAHVDRGIDDPPPLLRNAYAVIPTNPARHDAAYVLAMAFVGHLTGPGQRTIADFRVDGERAFRPIGRREGPNFEQYVPSDWER